ncbi:MAG: TetR/AcrR family transcriptional regulator [Merdibacter sp.]
MPKKTYQCSIQTRNLILRKVHDEAAQNNEMPSIKEICASCGLSRGTFYLYFPSMDAALSTLAQEHGEMLRHQVHAYQQDLLKQRLLPRAIAIFQWLKDDLDFYRFMILKQKDAELCQTLSDCAERLFVQEEEEICGHFLLGGLLVIILSWLAQDRPIGPYVISVQLEELYQHLQIEKKCKKVLRNEVRLYKIGIAQATPV